MDNEKWLWEKLWGDCISSKNPLCTRIRDRSAQLQSLGWRYPVCPTDSRIDIMFVGINPRKNTKVKIDYNDDFEEYYEESKEKSFMNDSHFKNFHKPLLRKIKKEGYHPTSFFTEVILCPTKDGVSGLGKRAEDIANTCTSTYLKQLIESEMPKVIVAEGNLPVKTIRKQFGLPYEEVQVTKKENIGKKEIIRVDHNNLWLIWSPHPNTHFDKEISKNGVIEKICCKIVNILKVS
jgi:hypothetical protein